MSELIDTPVFYNLAPRPIKYRVSVPIPTFVWLVYRYDGETENCEAKQVSGI